MFQTPEAQECVCCTQHVMTLWPNVLQTFVYTAASQGPVCDTSCIIGKGVTELRSSSIFRFCSTSWKAVIQA